MIIYRKIIIENTQFKTYLICLLWVNKEKALKIRLRNNKKNKKRTVKMKNKIQIKKVVLIWISIQK